MMNEKMDSELQDKESYIENALYNPDMEKSLLDCAKVLEWALKNILQLEKVEGAKSIKTLGALLDTPAVKKAVPENVYKPLKKFVPVRNKVAHQADAGVTREQYNEVIGSFRNFWKWFKKYCDMKCFEPEYMPPIFDEVPKKKGGCLKIIIILAIVAFIGYKLLSYLRIL
ncbi:MAG: hypothetical protein IJL80_14635 [Treponema sp.]|nr:hypothetical protein [Treponema sp.]